ncbi:MAG TPA: hypothetical protein VFG50_01195 [Rhodothermales bacterium]|nr:hypothetical protein [Rhodothermales bacterium]
MNTHPPTHIAAGASHRPDRQPGEAAHRCRCGHDRGHPLVQADPTFGFWSWFMLFNGASGTPKKLTYRCTRCGEVFGTTRDPKVLRAHRNQ